MLCVLVLEHELIVLFLVLICLAIVVLRFGLQVLFCFSSFLCHFCVLCGSSRKHIVSAEVLDRYLFYNHVRLEDALYESEVSELRCVTAHLFTWRW